ncbi:MAG: threonylcarbamoyl-AMP synthase [Chloroflexi bacterium]|nr:threonylcarbamoyl-AMP synthase [Chloroflexota bacterium]
MIPTVVLPITDAQSIPTAQEVIARGGVVVFPTDTLYGLACDFRNIQAIEKVYAAKGRSASKALPVLISDSTQLNELVLTPDQFAHRLMSRYWPGPLTIVLPKIAGLPYNLTPYPGLAVRMPAHPFALKLLSITGPLAVTSANLSDHPSPHSAQEVLEQLSGRVDLVLDGGSLAPSPGSTIIDCTTAEPKLLRAGPLDFEQIIKK